MHCQVASDLGGAITIRGLEAPPDAFVKYSAQQGRQGLEQRAAVKRMQEAKSRGRRAVGPPHLRPAHDKCFQPGERVFDVRSRAATSGRDFRTGEALACDACGLERLQLLGGEALELPLHHVLDIHRRIERPRDCSATARPTAVPMTERCAVRQPVRHVCEQQRLAAAVSIHELCQLLEGAACCRLCRQVAAQVIDDGRPIEPLQLDDGTVRGLGQFAERRWSRRTLIA